MPPTGQGISVGDAVLTFLGDTTNLDQSFEKVKVGTESAIKPGTLAVKDLGVAWNDAEIQASIATEQYTAAGRAALRAGEEGALAGQAMAFSMREAKGELALVGEEFGIHIPRHIRSFVSELPGVGAALNAAFSATAILFVIQIIAEATSKLTEWIGATYIYTEANKAAYDRQVALNNAILDQTTKLAELKKAYDFINLEGPAKTSLQIVQLMKSLSDNEKALNDARDAIFRFNAGYGGTATSASIAGEEVARLTAVIAAQRQEVLNLTKTWDQEVLTESIKHGQALIAAQMETQNAINALTLQRQRVNLAMIKSTYSEQLAAQSAFEDAKYRIELAGLERRLQELKRDPTRNANEIIATNAQIETLQTAHQTAEFNNLANLLERLKQIRATYIDTTVKGVLDSDEVIITDATRTADAVAAAFAKLGIANSSFDLYAHLLQVKKGFEELGATGRATYGDLLKAQIAVAEAQINYDRSIGNDVKKEQEALDKLTNSLAKYTGQIDIHNKRATLAHTLFKTLGVDASEMGSKVQNAAVLSTAALGAMFEAWARGGVTAEQAAIQIVDAVLGAIAKMAFANATVELAKGFAAMSPTSPDFGHSADHFASAALWFSAGAAASVVGGLLSGVGQSSGQSSSSSSGGAGASAADQQLPTAAPVPVQVQNVQHFGAGALISKRTLAVVGDSINSQSASAREGILPLDNPDAMHQIGAAIGPHIQNGGNVYVEGLISPDNLGKVMKKMNQRVKKGQGNLLASNSLRVTKRSI